MQRGDVVLVSKSNPLSLAIRACTGSKYSHSCLYLGKGKVIDAAFGGVKVRDLKHYTAHHGYAILRPWASPAEIDYAIAFARLKIGAGYDYLGLVGIGWEMFTKEQENPWDNKDKYWCSELIADAYLTAGLKLEGIKDDLRTWRVSPEDLRRSDSFTEVIRSP